MIHGVLSFHVCLQYEPLAYWSICTSSHNSHLLFIHTSLLTWEPGSPELNCIQNRICVIYDIKHTHTHTHTHTHSHTHTCICCCSVSKPCPTLCDSMGCSQTGSLVHGVLQVEILGRVTISFFKESSRPKDKTLISSIGTWILYHWAI